MKHTLTAFSILLAFAAVTKASSPLSNGRDADEMSRSSRDGSLDNIILVDFDPEFGLPYCQCITACYGDTVVVAFGPGLNPEEVPVYDLRAGCQPEDVRIPIPFECDEECIPVDPLVLQPFEYDAATGTFRIKFWVLQCGCFCLCLDGLLDVELSSFDAQPRDGEIELHWATASETAGSRFEIMRGNSLVHRVDAAGSASGHLYSWMDTEVTNGTEYTYTLVALESDGGREVLGSVSATPNFGNAIVAEFTLYQNFPNPFNPETNIAFDLAETGFVNLHVFNMLGQNVATPVSREMESGRHIVLFDAADLPSGLYLYRLESGSFVSQKKMILMK